MTRAKEKGDDEITLEAKREAARTGKDICDILKDMLSLAKAARDKVKEAQVKRAEKFLGCRNKRKRGNRR